MSFLRVAFFQQWRVFNGCNEHPRGSPGSQSAMPLSCQAMWPRWRACSKVLTCWLCPACRAPPWRLMFARCGWVRRTSLCARGTQSHHGWNLTDLPAISLPACQVRGMRVGLQMTGVFRRRWSSVAGNGQALTGVMLLVCTVGATLLPQRTKVADALKV